MFSLLHATSIYGAYCTWRCGGYRDDSDSHSALGFVDSDRLNYGYTESSKWLLIGVMRNALWFPHIQGSVWKCDSFDQGILELFFFPPRLIAQVSFLYCDGICLVSRTGLTSMRNVSVGF